MILQRATQPNPGIGMALGQKRDGVGWGDTTYCQSLTAHAAYGSKFVVVVINAELYCQYAASTEPFSLLNDITGPLDVR